MACAEEHQIGKDGGFKYNRQMVYDWLDRIRENGLQQSFLERDEERWKEVFGHERFNWCDTWAVSDDTGIYVVEWHSAVEI